MEQYRLSKQGIRTLTGKSLRKSLVITLFALSALIVMGPLNVTTGALTVTPMWYVVPVLFGLMLYGMLRNDRRLREVLQQYTISLTGQSITREQGRMPALEIPLSDITAIYQKPDGLLIVAGRTTADLIVLMPELENFGELEAKMKAIRSFSTVEKDNLLQRYPIQVVLAALTVIITFYLSQNKVVQYVAGIPLIAAAAWGIWQLFKARNTQHALRRSGWALMVILLCLIFSILLRLVR
ncbi:hypothetical protein MKQ68_19840 [Chitinophaga horti]|uniref:Bacterial Pleckstrin homology domain-containing protein n=1 Tax=Chitinophaga horti TaxID=2920382 RepID=A0ABY6IY77_9BACT|nr:hypothetical protein [Chitinophaga horti]UYQ92340.1 hypothetical protein MKQ68_19840 [Chitinophaga horti]